MKKLLPFITSFLFAACAKDTVDTSPWSLTQVGLEYNTGYKVQQFMQFPADSGMWDYYDLAGPVIVTFLNDSTATEKKGDAAPVTQSFKLTGRQYWDKPEGYQYSLDFFADTSCLTNCPTVTSSKAGCVLFRQFAEIVLHKPSSQEFLEGYRFVRQ